MCLELIPNYHSKYLSLCTFSHYQFEIIMWKLCKDKIIDHESTNSLLD